MSIKVSSNDLRTIYIVGDTIEGHFIPGGTRVGVAIKAIMRDPRTFGDDANIFRPERWINRDPAERRIMSDTVELIFGYGRWGCSGKPVAMMELNKIFIQVCQNYLAIHKSERHFHIMHSTILSARFRY